MPKLADEQTSLIDKLLAIQKELKDPFNEKSNPYYNSSYAPLIAVIQPIREICNKHGVFLYQPLKSRGDGTLAVKTVVSSGNSEMLLAEIPIKMSDNLQKVGSAITYARRYSLMAAFALSGNDDDDGNAASQQGQANHSKSSQNQSQKPTDTNRDYSELTRLKEEYAAIEGVSDEAAGKAIMAVLPKPFNELNDDEFRLFIASAKSLVSEARSKNE